MSHFNADWIDPTLWSEHLARKATLAEYGHVRLMNRGSLVTVQEFTEPISVSLDWQWHDLEGHMHYRDSLTVVLRTNGRHDPHHPFEIRDGVHVTLDATAGQAIIHSTDVAEYSPRGSVPLPAGKWHHLRITDDGQTIAVYLSGPAIDGKFKKEPLVTARPLTTFAERHIAIYNRERVADIPHESLIDNVLVERLGD